MFSSCFSRKMLGVWDGFLQKSTKISHLPVPSLPVEPAARQRGAAASSNQRRGCGSAAAKERLSREALADGDFPMFFPILMVILDGDFWIFVEYLGLFMIFMMVRNKWSLVTIE